MNDFPELMYRPPGEAEYYTLGQTLDLIFEKLDKINSRILKLEYEFHNDLHE